MKEDIKDFLSFNKAERRGVFLLSVILLLLLAYNIFGPFGKSDITNFSEFDASVKRYEALKDSASMTNRNYPKNYKKKYTRKKRHYSFKSFDPNVINKEEWIEMGLTKKQAQSIIKYTSKGGKFYVPDDLRKMYCLSSYECDLIIPHVFISEEIGDRKSFTAKEEYLQIDLNAASSESLELVRGIGPAIAKGILNYKQLLGGYSSVNQLNEVFLIDVEKYESIKNNFIVNIDSIHTMNVNNASYYDMRKHPYISKQLAYEIVQHRSQKGSFKESQDLLKVNGMSDSLYQKIYPYFALPK